MAAQPSTDTTDRAGSIGKLIAIWLALVALGICLAWLKQPGQVDDAFIYLRYVRNIVEGRGWVYNEGEWVNGATSTGNTLLLTLFSWLTGERYVLAQILIFGIGIGSAAFFVWRTIAATNPITGIVAGACIATTPYLYWLVGMDTAPILGFAAAGTWAYWRGRYYLASAFLCALFLTRPDGVFLVFVLFAHLVWTNRGELRARAKMIGVCAIVFCVPILAWAIFSWVQFGTALPKTLGAKIAQTESGIHGQGNVFVFHAMQNIQLYFHQRLPVWMHGWLSCFVAPGILGIVVAACKRSRLLPLVLFGVLQSAAYGWLNLPNYLWYFFPMNLAFAIGVATLAGTLLEIRGVVGKVTKAIGVVIAGMYLFATAPDPTKAKTHYPHYYELTKWVRANAKPGTSIACAEIGVFGYELKGFRIIDMWGLVTAGGVEAISRGDFAWWYRDVKPDLVVMHDPIWEGPEKAVAIIPEFLEAYERVYKGSDRFVFRRKQ